MIQPLRTRTNPLQRHVRALHTSSELTLLFRRMYRHEAAMVSAEQVIAALHGAGVRFILMGTHGIGGYRRQARATEDVDVLVAKREIRKAKRALCAAFPELQVRDTPVVMRFIDPGTGDPVIDLMKPTQEVYRMVFRHTIAVGKTHRIPTLEMALASKFAAMVSPNRERAKKIIDAGDFVDIVTHHRSEINLKKLRRLGDKVYPDGGTEILHFIDDIDEGRPIEL